jgi:NitT/TauT family transport system substrate-binding protein
METDDAEKYLGGRYEFMGGSARTSEISERREQMRALVRALEKGLGRLQSIKPEQITASLPHQPIEGVDTAQLTEIFGRYRASLYPTQGVEDPAACDRVAETLKFTGLIKLEINTEQMLDLSIAGS